MKNLNKILIIVLIFFVIALSFYIKTLIINKANTVTARNIIQANQAHLDSIGQLIIVYNEKQDNSTAILTTYEKINEKWKLKFGPLKTYIGRNGFASKNQKVEGDNKTPTGLFRFGQLFSYAPAVKTKLPFIKTTKDDKWIDDPESPDYNTYVRGETSAKSFEKLLLNGIDYKYCLVINYNTKPVIKEKGSAIFFHISDAPTSGCVAISEKEMKEILNWLSPCKNPSIIMGNKEELIKQCY